MLLGIYTLFDYKNTTHWQNSISLEKYKAFNEVFEKLTKGSHRSVAEHYDVLLNHNELYNMINTYMGWKIAVVSKQKELLENTITLKKQIETELEL